MLLFVAGILFLLINIYWNNKLYKKKVELEKAERDFRCSSAYIDLYEGLASLLETIDDGLGEWQTIEAVYCPDELQSFRMAKEKVKELIHDMEVLQ